jgi:hypothetical protein
MCLAVPHEWYQGDRARLSRLIETLHERRSMIRDLITQFRQNARNPFPNWKHTPQVAVPAQAAVGCRAGRGTPGLIGPCG